MDEQEKEKEKEQKQCDHYNARHDDQWLLKYDYCYDCGKKI